MKKIKIFTAIWILMGFVCALQAQTKANTKIVNQASAVYKFQGQEYQTDSNLVITQVQPVYGLDISPDGSVASPGQSFYGIRGSETLLPYVLVNTGNEVDHYTLNVAIESGSTFHPSNVRIARDLNGNGRLESNEPFVHEINNISANERIHLLVHFFIPTSTHVDDRVFINLIGQSKSAPTVNDGNNVSRVSVVEGPVIRITMKVDPVALMPGDTIQYAFEGSNVGHDKARAVSVTLDGAPASGVIAGSSIPESASGGTSFLIGSSSGAPGTLVYSNDHGASWLTVPTGTINRVGLLFPQGLDIDQTFEMRFKTVVNNLHEPGIIENKASVVYQDASSVSYNVISNPVETRVGETVGVFLGPQGDPFAAVGGDTNADFQELEKTNTGVRLLFKFSIHNDSSSPQTLNLYWKSLPERWSGQFLHVDGKTPLLDTDGNNLPDVGVLPAKGQADLSLALLVPTSPQNEQNSFVSPKASQGPFAVELFVALSSNLSVTNRTNLRITRVDDIEDIWKLSKTNSPANEVKPGERIRYELIFEYLGTDEATDVVLNDVLSSFLAPPQFNATTIVSDENGSGKTLEATATYDPDNHILSWKVPAMPANFKGRVTFFAEIVPGAKDDELIENEFSLISSLNKIALVSNRVSNRVAATSLYIEKNVNKRKAVLGDLLLYTLKVWKASSGTMLRSVKVLDELPHSLRYEKGTTLIDGRKSGDPEISSDGRRLTFSLGDIQDERIVQVQFFCKIGPDAKIGDIENVAQAFGFTEANARVWSFPSRAVTTLDGGVFAQKAWVFGRVYVDLDDNGEYDCETDVPLPGIRLYMENGQYAITDRDGKYSIEDLSMGTHVISVDSITLPPQMAIKEKGRHSAGYGKTQFVDIKLPGPWRSDFRVELQKGSYLPCQAFFKASVKEIESKVLFRSSPLEKTFRRTLLLPEKTDAISLVDRLTLRNALDELSSKGTMSLSITVVRPKPERSEKGLPGKERSEEKTGEAGIRQLLPKIQALIEWVSQRFGFTQDRISVSWDDKSAIELPKTIQSAAPKKTRGILSPADGAVYMIESGIKVKVSSSLQNRISLFANDKEVPADRIGSRSFDIKSSQTTFEFVGVPLLPGKNVIKMVAKNPKGKTEEETIAVYKARPPKKISARLMPAQVPADGRTEPIVLIELQDEEGKPATSGLFLTVKAENTTIVTPDAQPEQLEHQLYVKDGKAECVLGDSREPREAKLTIKINDLTHEVKIDYLPYLRDWIIVGIGEATAGIENFKGKDKDEGLYVNGRVAFFLKGRILGKLLLTAQYDSGMKGEDRNSLLKKVDPDKYYPVYGDSSEQGHEIQSTGRLYVKLEYDRNYVMYGDYQTEVKGILTGYNRTLRGIKGEVRTEYLDVKVFGTRAQQVQVKDEIRGRGISGYYFLSHDDVIENTLQVAVETRDRNQPQIVLQRIAKRLYVDYDADFTRGMILFDTPIASADDQGNPNYIVAIYESKDAASKEYIAGGQFDVKLLGEKVKVGGTYIYEGQNKGQSNIAGLHAEIKPIENVTIRGEMAKTRMYDSQENKTKDGRGYAVEATASFDSFKARAGYHKISKNFRNPSVSGVEEDTEKFFAEMDLQVSKDIAVNAKAQRAQTRETRIQGAGVKVVSKTGDVTTMTGYQYVEEKRDGEKKDVHILMGGAKVDLTDNLSVKVERHQTLPGRRILESQPLRSDTFTKVGSNVKEDFVSGANGYRLDSLGDKILSKTIVGADYTPYPWLKLWANQEFNDNFKIEFSRTLFGVNLQLTKHLDLYSTYGIENSIESTRNQALMGVRTNIPVTNWLSGDLFLERVETFDEEESLSDFTAYGFGFKMSRVDQQGSGRFEFRHTQKGLEFLATPALTLRWDDSRMSFWRTRHSQQNDVDHFLHNTLLGMAYRPNCSDRVNLIGKVQFDWERNFASPQQTEEISLSSSFDLHFRPFEDIDVMLRYANKYTHARYAGVNASAFTDLIAGRFLYEISERFDVGIHGGVLHEYGSDQFSYAYGAEIGCKIVNNLWFSVGYNLKGFSDKKMTGNDFLQDGFYVTVRFKFDEKTAEELTPAW